MEDGAVVADVEGLRLAFCGLDEVFGCGSRGVSFRSWMNNDFEAEYGTGGQMMVRRTSGELLLQKINIVFGMKLS